MKQQEPFPFDTVVAKMTALLDAEQQAGRRVNGLAEIKEHQERQQQVHTFWKELQDQMEGLKNRMQAMPALPPYEQIARAQSILAMSSLVFLEIDTTGTLPEDEIVRITLSNGQGVIIFDRLVKPERAQLSSEASQRNGLSPADLEDAPTLISIWPALEVALRGKYVISFSQDFDRKVLKEAAERYALPPVIFIGECLQRHCTRYYAREYSLDLGKVAARMGYTLSSWNAEDRLQAQRVVLVGLASGLTDLRPPEPVQVVSEPFDDGSLDDDDHPF